MENDVVYVVLYAPHGLTRFSGAYGSVFGVYKERLKAEVALQGMKNKFPNYLYWYEIHGVTTDE